MENWRDVRMQDGRYPIIEIFESIQFEGARCGTLNGFVRLAGCNLCCPFCDTSLDKPPVWLNEEEIVAELRKGSTRNVVITGGEPMIHDLRPLLMSLQGSGFYVAMESNGTQIKKILDEYAPYFGLIHWLTVSPKTYLLDSMLESWASEVKYVIPDAEALVDWDHHRVFLQPEWNNPDALARCMKLLGEHPFARLSSQTHKYLGLR